MNDDPRYRIDLADPHPDFKNDPRYVIRLADPMPPNDVGEKEDSSSEYWFMHSVALKRDVDAMDIARTTGDWRTIERLSKSARRSLEKIEQWARSQRWLAGG